MSKNNSTPTENDEKGLFRALLGSTSNTLESAFGSLKDSHDISRMTEHPGRGLLGARVNLSPDEGEGYWDFFKLNDDLFVVVANFTYTDSRKERMAGEGFIEFHIKLSGHLNLSAECVDPLEVDGPSLLVWNQPEGVDADEWIDSNQQEKSITIYCRSSFLTDNLIDKPEHIPQELEKFIENAENNVNYCQLPITPEVLQAAIEIGMADERFDGMYWLIYVQAKTLELLCMILTAFDQLSDAANVSFSDYELEQFEKAKEIACAEFHPPPTIKQIARRVGINETKLKAGFKALFGMTIFDFRHRSRMQQAKDLLDNGKEQLGMVAEKVGYKHQTTFTTAFKAYFGINPKDYRKLRNLEGE